MAKSLFERLDSIDELTPTETILAEYFYSNYPDLAFRDLREICGATSVSTASVTRFVRKLGYEGFRSFLTSIRAEISSSFDRPLQRDSETSHPDSDVRHHISLAQAELTGLMDLIDDKEYEEASKLVCDYDKTLYLASFATGRSIIEYFYLLAQYHRGNTVLLPDVDMAAHELVDITAKSVLLVTSFDRYARHIQSVMDIFHQRGASIILITNRRNSPFRRYADRIILIPNETSLRFKSRLSMLIVLESFLSAMEHRNPTTMKERTKAIEDRIEKLDLFIQPDKSL